MRSALQDLRSRHVTKLPQGKSGENILIARKIVFVTGTRADFGKLDQLATIAAKNGHHVSFFVTGMHMYAKYGLTKEEVRSRSNYDFFEFINGRESDGQELVIAKTICGFSDFITETEPDLVVVHGDRPEALACCIVCATKYIRCAHIEGGEVSGTIDEVFRHCNTKLAHIHLVSSENAKNRVRRLGEDAGSIWTIGSPELDVHREDSAIKLSDVRKRYEIKKEDYGICIFHPVTSEVETTQKNAQCLFEALKGTGKYFIVIAPNNDPGSNYIFQEIDALPGNSFRILPSIRFDHFSTLLKNTSILIGNSSTGVREAPFLGIPSVNVGTRQNNRSSSNSIFHCDGFNTHEITTMIELNWGKRFPTSTEFGEGHAGEKFLELLLSEQFWELPLQKYFVE